MRFENETKEKLRRVNKYGIAGIILVLIFIAIEINLLFLQSNTFDIVFAFEGAISEDTKESFANFLESAIKSDYPEGKFRLDIKWISYDLKDPESLNALSILLAQSDYSLYILSDQPQELEGMEGESRFEGLSSLYCSKGWFDPLEAYGLQPDEKYDSRALVNKNLLLSEFGMEGIDFYVSLIDWYRAGSGKEQDLLYAISAVKHLTQR